MRSNSRRANRRQLMGDGTRRESSPRFGAGLKAAIARWGRWSLASAACLSVMLAAALASAQDGADTSGEVEVQLPASGVSVITGAWWVAPIASVLALGFAVFFYKKMMEASEGSDRMKEIAGHVRDGAMAYLSRQYKVVTTVFIVLLVILFALALNGIQNPFVPIAFLTGGFFSGLCGYIGMRTATNASARTAQGCSEGLNRGLQVAFRSGAVMGLVVVALACWISVSGTGS